MGRKSDSLEQYTEQLGNLASFIAHACAFTGHRPQKLPWRTDEADPGCVALKAMLAAQIDMLIENGYTEFLSGMAPGVDMWAAQMILDLREKHPGLKLHCILPCAAQSAKWTAALQMQYRAILEQADSIIFVNRGDRKNCMLERNRFLVSYASVVLAVYNGEKRGGTAATVRYARKLGRELIVIDPATLTVNHETKAALLEVLPVLAGYSFSFDGDGETTYETPVRRSFAPRALTWDDAPLNTPDVEAVTRYKAAVKAQDAEIALAQNRLHQEKQFSKNQEKTIREYDDRAAQGREAAADAVYYLDNLGVQKS